MALCNIDLRVGEARVIRDITCKLFDLDQITAQSALSDWEYHSNGYRPLVQCLEQKHEAPIIITNGANHALHACMYALRALHCQNMGIRIPYWSRIPEIARLIGINYTPFQGALVSSADLGIDSLLLTLPNNPDGFIPSSEILHNGLEALRNAKIPVIHDAVYYTRSYLPVDYPILSIGDAQIFSASKSYGLSSLRVGYIVVYNKELLKPLQEFVEISTVGVSILSQKLFLHILTREMQLPFLRDNFVKSTREELNRTKNIFKKADSNKVELPVDFDKSGGMFAWVKPKKIDLFEKIKVDVLHGNMFGMPGYVRINLAAGADLITEVVKRINNFTD